MKTKFISLAVLLFSAVVAFGQTNEEKALALIAAFETGDQLALDYVGTTYINHNLSVPSGPEILQGFITGTPSGVTTATPRSFEVGDYVITHTVYGGVWNGGIPQVGFDVFRFEDGLIVEHWDNLSAVVDDMDGTSQTDGAVTPVTNLDETDANDTLLEEMAQTLFVDGDWTDVGVYFDLDNYIQHSVGSGADGAFLATLEGQTGLSFYDDVKFIHTLGSFGLVMSEGPDITGVDTEGTYAYYDLFRMENNQIIEHWDVIQLIPTEEDWANNNGKWGDDALIAAVPEELTIAEDGLYPEDIVIANSKVYVSGLGNGTIVSFDLAQDFPAAQPFAPAQDGYTQSWGLASDGSVVLNILNNPNFADLSDNGPSKLVEYDILTGDINNEWDLPTTISNSVQIIDGKYYVCEWAPTPRIYEIDPATNTINENWFTSTEWDASISGLGGVIYNGTDAFYLSQGNELWYLPISGGTPGTLEQVTTTGIDIVDADGITWGDGKVYYAANDAGDPEDNGTVYQVEFTDATTATVSVVIDGLDDTSGVWYLEEEGEEYIFINVSQMGVIFGLDEFDSPFTIEVLPINTELTNEEKALALIAAFESGDQAALDYVGTTYINHNLSVPSGPEILQGFITGTPSGVTTATPRSFEVGDYVITHTVYGGVWNGGVPQVGFDVFRFEDGLIVEHWDNLSAVVDDMDGTSQTDGSVTPVINLDETDSNDTLLEEMAQTLFVDGDWTDVGVYFDLDNYIQHSVGSGPDGAFLATLEGQTGLSFYDDVKFIHTLGNFGLVMSEGPDITGVDTEGTYAYYDLFRMENNQIIEHWDVIQLIPAEEDWANNNGKWGDDALIAAVPEELTIAEDGLYPEDIVIANSKVYVSGLGDGTIVSFDLAQDIVDAQPFAPAQDGYAQSWGLASDGSVVLNILNNPNFADLTDNGPSKLVEYDILTGDINNEWDLPASTISNSVQIIDGKYYVCEWAPTPRIYEIDPATNTINENWFTSTEWDASISGLGGVIYNGTDAFYLSQGNELWYLPISGGTPGTLEQVTTTGIDIVDADGITWGDGKVYYATNDAGDPEDNGTVYQVEFTDATTATVSVVIDGLDDTSGVWYLEEEGEEYIFINVSQMGVIFGLDEFDSPFTIEILNLDDVIIDFIDELNAEQNITVAPNPFSSTTNILISVAALGNYQLEVYDMTGKKIITESLSLVNGENTIPFSSDLLKAGLYSFSISNGVGVKTGKMLVTE